jgi:23S rRNA (guanosine2251-2'-O)-methyltransferase
MDAPMAGAEFLFFQCLDNTCRFRFPASAKEAPLHLCPRCGSEVVVAAADEKIDSPCSEDQVNGTGWIGLLDNIRSIHNTGSMFRTADGAGFAHLYLCGITATPAQPRLAKAALGSQETVSWSYARNGVDLANQLLESGCRLWALERLSTRQTMRISGIVPADNCSVLVVGNEKAGIDPGILALCDGIIGLPMVGQKSSLNVAVAFGIAAYQLQFGPDSLIWQAWRGTR